MGPNRPEPPKPMIEEAKLIENKKKPQQGKRGKLKVVLVGVALVAVGSVALLAYLQRENIRALYLASTENSSQLQQQVEEQGQKRDDILAEYGLTAPDKSGGGTAGETPEPEQPGPPDQSSQQEAPASSSQEKPSDSAGLAAQPSKEPPKKEGELDQKAKDKIQGYVNELYALEDQYMATLDRLIQSTKDEYHALPKEKQTRENKIALVKSKMEILIAEEKTCDAAVEKILGKIQAVLDENKVKNNLVSDIRDRYKDSKITWKAARMAELYR